jgi:hypothetical protein
MSRYNTGDTKVPWAAVGENYNAADTFEFVKFLMQGTGCDEKKIAATCPVTEKVFDERYAHLPIYGFTKEQVDFMVDAIAASVAEMKAGK